MKEEQLGREPVVPLEKKILAAIAQDPYRNRTDLHDQVGGEAVIKYDPFVKRIQRMKNKVKLRERFEIVDKAKPPDERGFLVLISTVPGKEDIVPTHTKIGSFDDVDRLFKANSSNQTEGMEENLEVEQRFQKRLCSLIEYYLKPLDPYGMYMRLKFCEVCSGGGKVADVAVFLKSHRVDKVREFVSDLRRIDTVQNTLTLELDRTAPPSTK